MHSASARSVPGRGCRKRSASLSAPWVRRQSTMIILPPPALNFSAAAAPLERDRRFLLCFKGVLVNMDHIAAQTGDELRLDDGSILPIAPRRRREILAQYRAYMFGRMREP